MPWGSQSQASVTSFKKLPPIPMSVPSRRDHAQRSYGREEPLFDRPSSSGLDEPQESTSRKRREDGFGDENRARKVVRFDQDVIGVDGRARLPIERGKWTNEGWEGEGEEGEEGVEGGAGDEADGPRRVLAIHAPWIGNISAAFYDPSTKIISVLEDTKDTSNWDLGVLLLEQCAPDKIVISVKTNSSLRDKLEEYREQHTDAGIVLQTQKNFTPSEGKHHLANLDIPILRPSADSSSSPSTGGEDVERASRTLDGVEEEYGGMGKTRLALTKLGTLVNVHAPGSMSAIGGLFNYLRNVNGAERLHGGKGYPPIKTLENLCLDQHMLINQDALYSLNIFDQERPNGTSARQAPGEKIILYGHTGFASDILNRCLTPMGQKLLQTWFLRPLLDLDIINARHDAVEIFAGGGDPEVDNSSLADEVRKAMKPISNIASHVSRIRKNKASLGEWKKLTEGITAIANVCEKAVQIQGAGQVEAIRKVSTMLSDDLKVLAETCASNIDWDMSSNEKRICFRAGVDDRLDEWREQKAELDGLLNDLAERVKQEIDARVYQNMGCQHWPQFGFLVYVVPLEGGHFDPPLNWSARFSNGNCFYFKNPDMLKMDEFFGDVDSAIMEREREIIQTLADKVIEKENEIEELLKGIGELDCLLALAKAIRIHDLVRPKMVAEPIMEVAKGRHLLQEMVVDHYIRNETKLEGGPDGQTWSSMMIVTGANGSGKSAYAKQVALIAFMAQIGSFVPAESATIGIVDKIFTRLHTRESVSKPQSAFMIDLAQVSHALRGATSRSLIILDEFGKGTTPEDGAGLLAGVIEYLLNGPCPRTIVLTHFHELFTQRFITDDLPVAFCHMKTELVEGSKQLAYLYKLVPGKCLMSNAAECALAHGLPRDIVDRGREVTELMANFELSKLWDKELSKEERQDLEEAEILAKKFLQWEIDPKTTDVLEVLKSMVESTITPRADEIGQVRQQGVPNDQQDGDRSSDFDVRLLPNPYQRPFAGSDASIQFQGHDDTPWIKQEGSIEIIEVD